MNELILKAAKQNLDRDIRRGLMGEITCWDNCPEEEHYLYLEEAKTLLMETGANYLPEYPDHEHITLEK